MVEDVSTTESSNRSLACRGKESLETCSRTRRQQRSVRGGWEMDQDGMEEVIEERGR